MVAGGLASTYETAGLDEFGVARVLGYWSKRRTDIGEFQDEVEETIGGAER